MKKPKYRIIEQKSLKEDGTIESKFFPQKLIDVWIGSFYDYFPVGIDDFLYFERKEQAELFLKTCIAQSRRNRTVKSEQIIHDYE